MENTAHKLKAEKEAAKVAASTDASSQGVPAANKWHQRHLTRRQWRTVVVLSIFVLCGVFASYMYYRTGGEYRVEQSKWLELLVPES